MSKCKLDYMKELKLTITHYKMLDTVKWLNDKHLYASALGVYKILHGDIDEDTVNLTNCPTFSTLISYGSKKVSRFLLALYRYGYLTKIYDKKSDELYLSITHLGRDAIEKYHKKHKQEYKKAKKKFKQEIVKIER